MEQKIREKVMEIRSLSISFKTMAGLVHAIRGVDIDLYRGETLAIVGESGSGKSVTMKAAVGILAKNGIVDGGTVKYTYKQDNDEFRTVDILKMKKKEMGKHINGKRIAMVFQDPMTSLDPTMTIGKQIIEGMLWHKRAIKSEEFAETLRRRTGLEVVLWDERLTTVAAHQVLSLGNVKKEDRGLVVDKLAAILILQGYLDWRSMQKESLNNIQGES
jgi:oligopeptide transport system ATP-binding protein